MTGFENFGAPQATAPDARMECGVCWTVYDPAQGDPVAQIAGGTSFADLPDDWRCPICDAPRERFLALHP